MKRCAMTLLLFILAAMPARAHFIWIVPDGTDGTKARVVFSDGLEADDAVAIEKIAGTKLLIRDNASKVATLGWKKDEHAYLINLPENSAAVLGGVCNYGVTQRGEAKPFLLAYYPKLIRGQLEAGNAWDDLRLEIVPRGGNQFQVVFAGKPAVDDEVIVLPPGSVEKETHKTDARGEFKVRSSASGLYGIRVRHVEARAGEHEGKKYEEVRHYATLVFRVVDQAKKAPRHEVEYAPLPRAVSSFGAAVAEGWLYVYGGHCGKSHVYSTADVLGTFRRLNLNDGKTWEDLPEGPPLQGLALAAYKGKLYRIGWACSRGTSRKRRPTITRSRPAPATTPPHGSGKTCRTCRKAGLRTMPSSWPTNCTSWVAGT